MSKKRNSLFLIKIGDKYLMYNPPRDPVSWEKLQESLTDRKPFSSGFNRRENAEWFINFRLKPHLLLSQMINPNPLFPFWPIKKIEIEEVTDVSKSFMDESEKRLRSSLGI